MCLLVSMQMHTLSSFLLSAEYAIWFHPLAIILGQLFLECHFGYSAGLFLSLTQDAEKKRVIMPNVLCASVLVIIMRPSVFMSLMCVVALLSVWA